MTEKIFESTENKFLQTLGIGKNIEQLNNLILRIAELEQENRKLKQTIEENKGHHETDKTYIEANS
jgi:uncharacterized protein (UPF0335 family)